MAAGAWAMARAPVRPCARWRFKRRSEERKCGGGEHAEGGGNGQLLAHVDIRFKLQLPDRPWRPYCNATLVRNCNLRHNAYSRVMLKDRLN
jgi:hypothetical protein